jgi:hypothetical protein
MFCWIYAKSSATFFTLATFFSGEPLPQGYIFEQGHMVRLGVVIERDGMVAVGTFGVDIAVA